MPTKADRDFTEQVANEFRKAGVLDDADAEQGKSSGKTYEKVSPRDGHKIYDRLIVMRDRYHGELKEVGLDVTLLLVHAGRDENGDPIGSALKHNGYAAMATIKKTSLKDRVAGLGDAVLIVDGDKWDEWTDAELDALLDHE